MNPTTLALKHWAEQATAEKKVLTDEIARLNAENTQFRKERNHVIKFIESDQWSAMNQRRADLIDRDVDGKLSESERPEYECLQLVARIIVNLAYSSPVPDYFPLFKAVEDIAKELRSALIGLRISKDNGGCWCEMAVGNPMIAKHSDACEAARKSIGGSDDSC